MATPYTLHDLYRAGNRNSVKLDHVRVIDVRIVSRAGDYWVLAGMGRVSLFDAPDVPRHVVPVAERHAIR